MTEVEENCFYYLVASTVFSVIFSGAVLFASYAFKIMRIDAPRKKEISAGGSPIDIIDENDVKRKI